jgi:DnaK suppressor protein
MAAKKKAARQKPKRGKKSDKKGANKKGSKKSKAAKRRPAKAARKPVKPAARKPVKAAARKPVKAAKPMPHTTTMAKVALLPKKPAAEKMSAMRVVSGSSKPVPAARKVVALKGVTRPAMTKVQPNSVPTPRDKPPIRTASHDYMNARQIEVFRKLLLDWKRSLMEEVDRTVHHMQDEASNFPDPNDRATQEEEFALELRTRDRERKLIKKIDEALSGLDGGDYGYCEICGVEIGIKRLEARPTATLCIDCKNLEEIKERQYG